MLSLLQCSVSLKCRLVFFCLSEPTPLIPTLFYPLVSRTVERDARAGSNPPASNHPNRAWLNTSSLDAHRQSSEHYHRSDPKRQNIFETLSASATPLPLFALHRHRKRSMQNKGYGVFHFCAHLPVRIISKNVLLL